MMNDNVKKIFEILGVKPNEKFKLESDATNTIYYITEDLNFVKINESEEYNFDDCFRLLLANKLGNIVKIPKTKKLRDWTLEDYEKWKDKNCNYMCSKCIFSYVVCNNSDCWVNHKNIYSDEFLNQKIEVEE